MKYSVKPSEKFEKDAKPLLKKYKSLKLELFELGKELSETPEQGTSLGKSCYKIRLAIKSKGKGKRGGSRVVTYVITENQEVVLLTIFDKSDKTDLELGELDEMLKNL
jgi:mRNA-degrading endonuclease RelE of RelBE toxin-antitoxin system